MAKYKDWRTFDPVTMRNEQIRNTPETARVGYSALNPAATVSGAYGAYGAYGETPDWAKRTPTEQARVNAAQARAQEQSASTTAVGYALLDPNASPYNGSMPTYGNAPTSGYAALSDEYIRRATTEAPTSVPATKPATVPNTGTVSPSTGETEATGYAKYLAQHPEYAKADREAEAEYARSLPTYGALAERMAQAGIHGGFSDYLQGVAYAKMQDTKQQNEEAARQGYADYLAQQDAEAKANAEKAEAENQQREARVSGLYQIFTTGGTDADGNAFDGLGLQNILDDTQYAQAVEQVKQRYKNLGYDEADINEAISRADADRQIPINAAKDATKETITALVNGESGAEDKFLKAFGYAPSVQQEDESDADYEKRVEKEKSEKYLDALDIAVDNGMITPEQRSSAITAGLPIYSSKYTNYTKSNWKSRASDLADTAVSAKMFRDNGRISDADYAKIVEDIKTKLNEMNVRVEEVHTVGWDNIRVQIGNYEVINADQIASVSPSKEEELTEKFGNSPLAVEYTGETDSEGNALYKLYYREGANRRWEELDTKAGSASGGRDNGNNIIAAIAMVMETQYKDTAPYTKYKKKHETTMGNTVDVFKFDLNDPTKSSY